jgi:hypothetical protein
MKRQIQFEISDNSSVLEASRNFFTRTGFKITNDTDQTISFSKGSTLLNMVTFNPLNWKSRINISIQNNSVLGDFDIDTTGQAVTAKEEQLWDKFIESYKISIVENVDLSQTISNELKETKKNSLKYVMWALIGAIVCGVPLGFLGYFTGIEMLAPMGAAGGGMLFMMNKINKDRQKNVL